MTTTKSTRRVSKRPAKRLTPHHAYESVDHGMRIRVEPRYLDDQSAPESSHFVWAYTIEISNVGQETVQLQSRVWKITDELGRTEEVQGAGVVGQTPVIPPGESFTYTSGCPLKTPQGIMVGSYQMVDTGTGRSFSVAIPAFSLDSPYVHRSMH